MKRISGGSKVHFNYHYNLALIHDQYVPRIPLSNELHGGSAGGLPEALQRLDQPGDGGGL